MKADLMYLSNVGPTDGVKCACYIFPFASLNNGKLGFFSRITLIDCVVRIFGAVTISGRKILISHSYFIAFWKRAMEMSSISEM